MSSNVFMNNQLERIADYIDAGKAGSTATQTVNIDFTNVGDMTGATAGTAGTHGLVPAPAAGDQGKTLHGDGTWRADAVDLPQVFGTGSGSIITLTDAADYAASDLVIGIEPVQSGSGDPSPDNIRRISGWTVCNVWRTGKNLVDETRTLLAGFLNANGSVSGTSSNLNKHTYMIPIKGGVTYTYSAKKAFSTAERTCCWYNANGAVVGSFALSKNRKSVSAIAPSNAVAVSLTIYNTTGQEIQLEVGNTATSHEPYTGQDYSITFPSEAGTVYGGTLDVVNGTLTVTKANIASYAGETLPGAWISDRDVYDPDNQTTPTTGAQVVYDLDTPLTYQAISTDVYLISGTCNVWAYTGDIITLEYVKADYNDLMQAVPKMKMPDYSAAIASGTYNLYDGFNYTATKDCIIYIMIGCDSSLSYPSVSVNNNSLGYIWGNTSGIEAPIFIPLKAGDVLDVSATNQGNNWTENYIIFALS